MARLTATEISSRRALDYRVIQATNCNGVLGWSAHRTFDDLQHNRAIDDALGLRGEAKFYLAAYHFPVLIGPGETRSPMVVAFDISHEHYPHAEPRAMVLTRPFAWSPHVHPASGTVCIGETWTNGRGRMLLAQLIVHVAHILNCDEPDREPSYGGWNLSAINYWRTTMNRQPLNPGLVYPVPSVHITHGVSQNVDDSFAPVGSLWVPIDEGFAPLSTRAAP